MQEGFVWTERGCLLTFAPMGSSSPRRLRWQRLKFLYPILAALSGVNASGAGAFFNIVDYGAHKDGSAPATEAIRAAIQAAKAAGGGTVYVPPGNYVTGPIELVNNLMLHIEAGATLRFSAVRLPFTKGRQQGIECLTRCR